MLAHDLFVVSTLVTLSYSHVLTSRNTVQSRRLLEEGEVCNWDGNDEWFCTNLEDCPGRNASSALAVPETRCKQTGSQPVVCCPQTRHRRATKKRNLELYCQRLLRECKESTKVNPKFVFDEEKFVDIMIRRDPEPFIVGGDEAPPATYTYMALLGYGDEADKSWLCGGSLINERYVLTAAHCETQRRLGPAKWIRLGDLDYSTIDDDAGVQDFGIEKFLVHFGYTEPLLYNDIALVRMDRDAVFTKYVRPLCLHTRPKVPTRKAVATGWGRTGFVKDFTSKLMYVTLDLINNTLCNEWRGDVTDRVPQNIKEKSQICTGSVEGGKDTCQGDSGSPLVIEFSDHCIYTQIGVTSFGANCALPKTPAMYTRVSFFSSWIEKYAFSHLNLT